MGEWGGAEFEGWNVRKNGEIMTGLLQPKDMSGSGTTYRYMLLSTNTGLCAFIYHSGISKKKGRKLNFDCSNQYCYFQTYDLCLSKIKLIHDRLESGGWEAFSLTI